MELMEYSNFHGNFAYTDPCGIMGINRISRMLGILKITVDQKGWTIGIMRIVGIIGIFGISKWY